jgi:hypothetical protein
MIYLATWASFLFVVLYLDWSGAKAHHVVAGLFAFPGVVVASLWCVWAGRMAYAAVFITAAFLVSNIVWFHFDAGGLGELDSLGQRIWTQLRIHAAIPREFLARSQYTTAVALLYWFLLMPLLQLILLPALVRALPRRVNAA